MPVFDVSFLRKSGGGSGSGILTDQLSILENSLSKDGYLSPGDYDLLIGEAQKAMNNPGLTKSQRSNFAVKVSDYQAKKAQSGFKSTDDITRMNDALNNEASQDVIMVGNDPVKYLAGREASYRAKLQDLADTIDRKTQSGDDISQHMQEYNETLRKYQDVLSAQQAHESFDGSNPVPGFAAYVTTNDRGEIVDVAYDRYGSKSGYVETNGMINGFQVYGKVNTQQSGKNLFVLGNQRFSAPDIMVPDPTNPGAMKVQRLVSESMQSGGAFKRGEQGFLNMTPDLIQTQSYIPRGSWAKSIDGTLYKRNDNGSYSKYLNYQPDGVDPKNILTIPKELERSILPMVNETIDASIPPYPSDFIGPLPIGARRMSPPNQPEQPGPTSDNSQQQPDNQNMSILERFARDKGVYPPKVNQRTESPQAQSPQNPLQYAKQTINKASNFFKDLFS